MYSKCDVIRNENSRLCSLTKYGQQLLYVHPFPFLLRTRSYSNGNIITIGRFGLLIHQHGFIIGVTFSMYENHDYYLVLHTNFIPVL